MTNVSLNLLSRLHWRRCQTSWRWFCTGRACGSLCGKCLGHSMFHWMGQRRCTSCLYTARIVCHRCIVIPASLSIIYICKSIGAAVITGGYYGQGTGSIVMSNVFCVGSEARLVDCRRQAFSERNCRHTADVGVRCQERTGQFQYHAAKNVSACMTVCSYLRYRTRTMLGTLHTSKRISCIRRTPNALF